MNSLSAILINHSRSILLLILFTFLTTISEQLFAQEPIELHRLTGTIVLDGNINEPAWENIPPLPMTMYQPTYRGTPTEQTEIRFAYDENYLYASGKFYDSNPSEIRVNSLYRDRDSNDDTFEILLDTFNDKENALYFWTNPAGIRGDLALSNDGNGRNVNWNTFWDVATTQTDEGWFAEIRIPFSSLGFSNESEKVTIGLITMRFIARKNERLLFPAISNNYSFGAPSKAQEIVLNNIKSQKPVYITPYFLGGLGQNSILNSTSTGYTRNNDSQRDAGLDIKYNITSNLTLDATINTDFAQVEADNQQVNLTRFSLFFPEKRRFFQERSGIFNFGTSMSTFSNLFYSRSIGLHEGKEVRILGGARLIGRAGKWDVGLINMQTERSEKLPSENFGVVRMRRQVINENSYAGGIVSSRIGDDGSYNVAYGLDGIFRVKGDEYLLLRFAQVTEDDLMEEKSFRFFDASSFLALWQRRSREGLNYNFGVARSGKDYEPGAGFITRRDYTEYNWGINYNIFKGEESQFRQLSLVQFFGFVATRNIDGSVESAQFEYDTDFEWNSGATLWADAELYYENLPVAIPFPDNTDIPKGDYTFYKIEGGYNMAPGRLFRTNLNGGIGSFYDGWRGQIGANTTWNISRHFSLNFNYNGNFVRFPDRDQKFNSNQFRLWINSALNDKFSMNGFVQYNNIDDVFTPNVRFRYNFREGNDFWFVYNEGFNTDRDRFDPRVPFSNDRTVLMKYTYTFQK
ncbi:MAG: carbohydrate binding family 9 domain-containing protein [bacterium]|nr:carbohydrate binding family 9 domain-containing protein [bacterium]